MKQHGKSLNFVFRCSVSDIRVDVSSFIIVLNCFVVDFSFDHFMILSFILYSYVSFKRMQLAQRAYLGTTQGGGEWDCSCWRSRL